MQGENGIVTQGRGSGNKFTNIRRKNVHNQKKEATHYQIWRVSSTGMDAFSKWKILSNSVGEISGEENNSKCTGRNNPVPARRKASDDV